MGTNSDELEIASEGRRRSLVVKTVLPQNEGRYRAVCETDESAADLAVESRDIRITKKPVDTVGTIGSIAKVVAVVNHTEVRSQWIWNGEQLESNGFCKITVVGKEHIIEFTDITAKMESGPLEFKAGKQSAVCQFSVEQPALEVVVPLENQVKATEMKQTILEVEVSRAKAEGKW